MVLIQIGSSASSMWEWDITGLYFQEEIMERPMKRLKMTQKNTLYGIIPSIYTIKLKLWEDGLSLWLKYGRSTGKGATQYLGMESHLFHSHLGNIRFKLNAGDHVRKVFGRGWPLKYLEFSLNFSSRTCLCQVLRDSVLRLNQQGL